MSLWGAQTCLNISCVSKVPLDCVLVMPAELVPVPACLSGLALQAWAEPDMLPPACHAISLMQALRSKTCSCLQKAFDLQQEVTRGEKLLMKCHDTAQIPFRINHTTDAAFAFAFSLCERISAAEDNYLKGFITH